VKFRSGDKIVKLNVTGKQDPQSRRSPMPRRRTSTIFEKKQADRNMSARSKEAPVASAQR
jgi:hypothetical protein